jgi:hypothetical protein
MLLVCNEYVSKITSEIQILNFEYLTSGNYVYVSKDVRIRGYFSEPKGVREEESVGNIAVHFL